MRLNSNAQNFRNLTGILEIPAEELLSSLLSNSQISSAVVGFNEKLEIIVSWLFILRLMKFLLTNDAASVELTGEMIFKFEINLLNSFAIWELSEIILSIDNLIQQIEL